MNRRYDEALSSLESKIAIAMGRLRTLNLASGDPEDCVAAVYAMMRVAVRDLGQSGPDWQQFMREALEEALLTPPKEGRDA